MFEYKTRTETIPTRIIKYNNGETADSLGGCHFYQRDILLFDYKYSGDIEIHCLVDYVQPGFGFVLAEDTEDISKTDNMFIVKLEDDSKYKIFKKDHLLQGVVRDNYIDRLTINTGSILNLIIKFTNDSRIEFYIGEDRIIKYDLDVDIKDYKIGFYSNKGNTINYAVIYSRTPSNWAHNIFNGQGGRINWFSNGFEIEENEIPCEAESQNIFLKKGKYYLAYNTDNKDIECYLYPTAKKLDYVNNYSHRLNKNGTPIHRGPFRFMSPEATYVVSERNRSGKWIVGDLKNQASILCEELDKLIKEALELEEKQKKAQNKQAEWESYITWMENDLVINKRPPDEETKKRFAIEDEKSRLETLSMALTEAVQNYNNKQNEITAKRLEILTMLGYRESDLGLFNEIRNKLVEEHSLFGSYDERVKAFSVERIFDPENDDSEKANYDNWIIDNRWNKENTILDYSEFNGIRIPRIILTKDSTDIEKLKSEVLKAFDKIYENISSSLEIGDSVPTTAEKKFKNKEEKISPKYKLTQEETKEYDKWVKEIIGLYISKLESELTGKYNGIAFEIDEDMDISLKFRGTQGKVTNIAIKEYLGDDFVATDYNQTESEASYIQVDLSMIKRLEMTATITDLPSEEKEEKNYAVAENGEILYRLINFGLELGAEYDYIINGQDRTITVNNVTLPLSENDVLYLLKNVNALVTRLIAENYDGDTLDILLQKTFRISMAKTITSPIIVTEFYKDEETGAEVSGNSLDLSSGYREVCDYIKVDIFDNSSTELELSNRRIVGTSVKVVGTNDNIDHDDISLESIVGSYTTLKDNEYSIDEANNKIKINDSVAANYKNVLVEYIAYNYQVDIFSIYNPINLSKTLIFNSRKNIRIAGVGNYSINPAGKTLKEITGGNFDLITDECTIDYLNGVVKLYLPSDIPSEENNSIDRRKEKFEILQSKYKYIIVEYPHCDNYKYEFTNYERQLIDLKYKGSNYLSFDVCDVINAMTFYGIPYNTLFRKDMLYRVRDKGSMNSIDYCAEQYEEITENVPRITNTKLIKIDESLYKKYEYIIIEYLKDDSYSINERDENYEIDIATSKNVVAWFDGDKETFTTKAYSEIGYLEYSKDNNTSEDLVSTNHFVVLNKLEE